MDQISEVWVEEVCWIGVVMVILAEDGGVVLRAEALVPKIGTRHRVEAEFGGEAPNWVG